MSQRSGAHSLEYSAQDKMKTGLGIRPEFFNHVLQKLPSLGFLEAHSENYFRPSIAREKLLALREHYPISLHGVGLSLGRADELDQRHLQSLKNLVDEVDPLLVSEHLAWSAYGHRHLPDLLPLPLTEEAFRSICTHITQMQDHLQIQILLENPSNYLAFDALQLSEPEFLNAVATQTGCGLLMDINNIYVSAHNLNRDAMEYLKEINSNHIKQYHLAGYTERNVDDQTILIDTHNQTVHPQVWYWYSRALEMHGSRPTLFEWDSDFPEFEVLILECEKADLAQVAIQPAAAKTENIELSETIWPEELAEENLAQLQATFLDSIIYHNERTAISTQDHAKRIWVYQNNCYGAINDYLAEVYPATQAVVDNQFFKQMCQAYVRIEPPNRGDIYHYGDNFAQVIEQFSALSRLPYLGDLIAYEWAIHNAYFAETKEPISPADYPQEELLQMPLRLNSGTWMYNSAYPIFEIHRQSLPSFTDTLEINLEQSQDTLLVYKRFSRVEMRALSPDEFLFIKNVSKSENLLHAIEGLSGSLEAENLSAALALTFELGILIQDKQELSHLNK